MKNVFAKMDDINKMINWKFDDLINLKSNIDRFYKGVLNC